MIQKSVLIGCREGSWVPCFGLRNPRLRVSASETTRLLVEHQTKGPPHKTTIHYEKGDVNEFKIEGSPHFIKVSVHNEFCPDGVLVQLMAEHALHTA